MKKTTPSGTLCRIFLFAALAFGGGTAQAQSEWPRWSAGVNVGVPFFWGDLSSFSAAGTYPGLQVGVEVERAVSPLGGLSLTLDYGWGKVGSYGYSENYYLTRNGDGSACLPGVRYQELYSKIQYFSAGLHGNLNLIRVFWCKESAGAFSVLLSPAIYLQHHTPRIYLQATDAQYTDSAQERGWGLALGTDVALRFHLSPSMGLQFKTGATWIARKSFEGINTPDHQRSNLAWTSSIGVMYTIH